MLTKDLAMSVLNIALSKGGDYADIFYENTLKTNINYDHEEVRGVNSGRIAGAGIRVIVGKKSIYAYASNITDKKLMSLATTISNAVNLGMSGNLGEVFKHYNDKLYDIKISPKNVSINEKVDMVFRANDAARKYSNKINEVVVSYGDDIQNVIMANSLGAYVEETRTRTRFVVQAIAEEADKREVGFFGPGKSLGFEFFDKYTPESIAEEAARISTVLLDADYAPQGVMPVVIDNAFGGVIFHEACGHALEATSVADNASVFTGKLGEKIASDCVTAIDNGTIPNEWGSARYDDECNETTKNVLIKNGELKSYMVDRLGSIKMECEQTGCGRRESYQYAPTSRMTNTYIAPGNDKFKDMISSIDNGIYCKNMGGGSVNPPTTDFNFAVAEAYLIKNGKIDKPVKGASLIGKGSEIMKNIEMVSDNLDFGI